MKRRRAWKQGKGRGSYVTCRRNDMSKADSAARTAPQINRRLIQKTPLNTAFIVRIPHVQFWPRFNVGTQSCHVLFGNLEREDGLK